MHRLHAVCKKRKCSGRSLLLQILDAAQDGLQHFVYAHVGGVHAVGILCGTQRSHGPVSVPVIALAYLPFQIGQGYGLAQGLEIAHAAQGAHPWRGVEEKLEAGPGEDHCAHVATFHHKGRLLAHLPLHVLQDLADHGHGCQKGSHAPHFLGADFIAHHRSVAEQSALRTRSLQGKVQGLRL